MTEREFSKKIKIAQVITRFIIGGAQKICLEIVEGLDKEKYEVVLITGLSRAEEGDYLEEAKRHVPVKIIPELIREVSLFRDLAALIKLYLYFMKNRFLIVHCHTSKAGFLGCLAAKLALIPVIIYTPHGHIFSSEGKIPNVSDSFLKFLFFLLRKSISLFANRIIALNNLDKKEQVDLGLAREDKYRVVHNCIDESEFAPHRFTDKIINIKKLLGIQGKFPILTTAGRLSEEKGHVVLIEALKEIISHFPEMILLIVGEGSQRQILEDKVNTLGLKTNVLFLGFQKDVALMLSVSDIFILPSLYEAFGISILEAMAMKVPVIATRVGGIPEVIKDGVDGILIEPKNPHSLSEAVIRLIQDERLRNNIVDAAYNKVIRKFKLRRMIEDYDKIYTEELNTLLLKRTN
jgi:glycosyltransferase involved in cell wall biosynthesis